MAHAGQTIENPVSGARITFRKTTKDTNGKLVEYDHVLKPHTGKVSEHIHLAQEERFEIITGRACYRLHGVERHARAGESVIIQPGSRHSNCWNDTDEDLHMRVTISPARNAEVYFETQFLLAQHGKTKSNGEMYPLQVIVIGNDIDSKTYLAGIPIFLQQMFFPILAAIGHLLGYRASYPEYINTQRR